MEKSKLQNRIDELSGEIDVSNSRIIDGTGKLHKATKLIHKLENGDEKLIRILEILNFKFDEQYLWMCPPIFRDAIVFYSKEDKIVGLLQICFGCDWIKNEKEEDFEVDHKIFPLLKKQLVKLGHAIY